MKSNYDTKNDLGIIHIAQDSSVRNFDVNYRTPFTGDR